MLSNKQINYLKKLANGLKSHYTIGKDGISDKLINGVNENLKAHEITKIHLLKSCPLDVGEASENLSKATNSTIVFTIGKTFVLYKKNPEKTIIVFPS